MREYKSGMSWCVWRWTDVRSEYIVRLHLVKTPWFAICIHWLLTADPELWLHDHPVSFLSIILRGWYSERRDGWYNTVKHRWFNYIKTSTRHSIYEVGPNTVTICFMGPKRQEWGFFVTDWFGAPPATNKVYWKEYYATK